MHKDPTWWNDDHTATWDRVKAAFRRDWEQTRHDLSGGRKGADLNQDVGDTVSQAFGDRHIPPPGVANPYDADELRRKVNAAERDLAREEERYEEGASAVADRLDRLEPTEAEWEWASVPLRYGVAASRRYGTWNPEVERLVRDEWTDLHPEREWALDREEIRSAWERAAQSQNR